MGETMKVGLCQTNSIDNVDINLKNMKKQMEELLTEDSSVRLILFPENVLYMRLKEGEAIQGLRLESEHFHALAAFAIEKKIFIQLGSVPLLMEDGFLYNSAVLITDQGRVEASYQKLHLFDIQLTGQKPIRESDVFRHGQHPRLFEVDGWKFGQSICYDIRFAELYSQYARQEADVILIPAAFLPKTGEAHWEIMNRARAIESQAYVLSAAQGGLHTSDSGSRETYGRTIAVDPWGRVLSVLGTDVGHFIIELKRSLITEVRTQIPMLNHRRLPVEIVK